jgi:hypothetical protein
MSPCALVMCEMPSTPYVVRKVLLALLERPAACLDRYLHRQRAKCTEAKCQSLVMTIRLTPSLSDIFNS